MTLQKLGQKMDTRVSNAPRGSSGVCRAAMRSGTGCSAASGQSRRWRWEQNLPTPTPATADLQCVAIPTGGRVLQRLPVWHVSL